MSSAANKVFAVPELLEHVLLDISTNEIYQNGMVKQLLLSWSCDLDNTVKPMLLVYSDVWNYSANELVPGHHGFRGSKSLRRSQTP